MKAGEREGLMVQVLDCPIFFYTVAMRSDSMLELGLLMMIRLVDHDKTTLADVFQVFFGLSMSAAGISQSGSLALDLKMLRVLLLLSLGFLTSFMIDRTTVIIAHRLSIVKNVNMIAVIHQGKIVEKGSHSELLQDPEGAYCQLIRLQEYSKELEQNVVNDMYIPEITADFGNIQVGGPSYDP